MQKNKKIVIGVIGLGYVGLPLAFEFSKKFETIGFDISKKRVNELRKTFDVNNELSKQTLRKNKVFFTHNSEYLKKINFYILAVPTPVNKKNLPDISIIKNVSRIIGKNLNKNDIVVLESTVYPGFSETFLKDNLEKYSNLNYNDDFYIGYSPERINPGDNNHSLSKIKKVVSCNNHKALKLIVKVYQKIIKNKIVIAKDIKTAEAAKVIENTQRDINIALINELSIIFNKLKIDTKEVLNVASTKWNFLNFYPGLVGGHCISVDPYYLTYISKKMNYEPKLILAARKMNDYYHNFIYSRFKKNLSSKNISLKNSKILILGLTYKPDVRDIRNSKVFNLINKLIIQKANFSISDPLIKKNILPNKYKEFFLDYVNLEKFKFSAILVSTNHKIIKMDYLKKISKKNSHIEYIY